MIDSCPYVRSLTVGNGGLGFIGLVTVNEDLVLLLVTLELSSFVMYVLYLRPNLPNVRMKHVIGDNYMRVKEEENREERVNILHIYQLQITMLARVLMSQEGIPPLDYIYKLILPRVISTINFTKQI